MRAGLALLLSMAATGCAEAATMWHRIGAVPGYPGMRHELQKVVDKMATTKVNHFCVIVADDEDAKRNPEAVARLAYVSWREGHYIFAYAPTKQSQIDSTGIWGAASFDLAERPPGVTRAFAKRVVETCRLRGDRFVVEKHSG